MSGSRLVRDSPDLARLVNEGFAVRVLNGFLVVDDIPFVDRDGTVQRGSFICPLDLNGDRTARPADHVMCFVGGEPCDRNATADRRAGQPWVDLWSAGPSLAADCGFSQKPAEGYADFYEKITNYAAILAGPAQARRPLRLRTDREAGRDRRGRRSLPLPRHLLEPRRDHPPQPAPCRAQGRDRRTRGHRRLPARPARQNADRGNPPLRRRRLRHPQRVSRAGRGQHGRAPRRRVEGGLPRCVSRAYAPRHQSRIPSASPRTTSPSILDADFVFLADGREPG